MPDHFDQSSRYLVQRSAGPMLGWLLGLGEGARDFVQWLDTRRIPWPGSPERTCDTVAWLRDPARGGLPWAAVVEFQIKPDPEMFGRLLIYLGSLWQEMRPSPLPGDRFCLAAVVVNLTGRGNCSREMVWEAAGVQMVLRVKEWNLAELDAMRILDDVEAKRAPPALLAWIPLMQGGAEDAIIQRWLALARLEPDAARRADFGLASVFAEAARCKDVWSKALEGWNVVESQVVKEWQDQARDQGRDQGRKEEQIKSRVSMLLSVLARKFGVVLQDSALAKVQATTDVVALNAWVEAAALASTFEEFQRDTGL